MLDGGRVGILLIPPRSTRQEVPFFYDRSDKMNRTHDLLPKAHPSDAVAVVGAEVTPSLAAVLEPGDRLMVEVNGMRMYSEHECPLVAEEPWTVVSNVAPRPHQKPTAEHKLILSHSRFPHKLVLNYANHLSLRSEQPIVFKEQDASLSHTNGVANDIYVTLQLVSHYIAADQVDVEFEPWDEDAATMTASDPEFRALMVSQLCKTISSFSTSGWSLRSVFRLAFRAFVSPKVVLLFRSGDEAALRKLPNELLLRVHKAAYWLPKLLEQADVATRDVYVGGHDD